MATLNITDYLAAAQSITWASGQTLNSASDNEWTDLSDEVNNASTKYKRAMVEIVLASAAFTGSDSAIEVYIVPTQDGTNYPNWSGNATADAQANNLYLAIVLPLTGTTAAQRQVGAVELPPGKFKWGFRNRGNVATAASGNSATWRPFSDEI